MNEPIHRETDIIRWAEDRNIFGGATAVSQLKKLREEVRELNDAVVDENTPEIIDGIGDVIVCLAIQASFHGLSLAECIEHAWDDIKDRKGRMIDGVFVKEADLLKREPWRAAIGCSPAGPNDPPPEERIRKSREGD